MIDSVNFIMKPMGDCCNLKCRYCFTNPDKYCGDPISVELLEQFIFSLGKDERFQHIKFTWHGGEPLLWGVEKYEELFDFQRRYLANKSYMNIFQTNGTLLNQAYVDLLKRYGAYIGISIDGPTYALNSQRFKTEKQFNRMTDNLVLLKENDVPFAIFCTLTSNNIDHLTEIFEFISAIRPYAYTLIPVMDSDFLITREQWSEVLNQTDHFFKKTGIQHSYTANLNSLHPKMCMMNGRCQSFITIDNNGMINKTCRINHDLLLGNLKDEDALDKIVSYAFKPLEIKENSIFSFLSDRKYIYFQGDGCYYRKQAHSNDDFIAGFVSYLKSH